MDDNLYLIFNRLEGVLVSEIFIKRMSCMEGTAKHLHFLEETPFGAFFC